MTSLQVFTSTSFNVVLTFRKASLPVRTTRLKRKREASSEPVEPSGTGTLRTSPEMQSKRHKAFFDEESKRQEQDMNVDEIYSQFNLGTLSGGGSQTQSQSIASGPAQAPTFSILPVVHEEETQTPDGNRNGLKRKATTTTDVEMVSPTKVS